MHLRGEQTAFVGTSLGEKFLALCQRLPGWSTNIQRAVYNPRRIFI